MPWRNMICLFNRHRPDSRSVSWNGTHHVSRCRDCNRPVRRSMRGYWKRLDAGVPLLTDKREG
ncbi:MAG: hypothetical protein WCL10_00230 [Novosphingobium sp.]|jgi:hypothetical protein|uniref:hypothetical protein n=1 Tax=Novosphingobium sp. TaxID=1874826 RepID=UPI003019317B